jgi:hypothetical protein
VKDDTLDNRSRKSPKAEQITANLRMRGTVYFPFESSQRGAMDARGGNDPNQTLGQIIGHDQQATIMQHTSGEGSFL